MKIHDNRSEFVAHQSQTERAAWTLPSKCERTPLVERRGENFWRASATGMPVLFPDDVEAANAVPPDASRTFRPAHMARRVSYWPTIVAVIVACASCVALIAWGVEHALRAHA